MVGLGGQGGCERRIEVFVKIQKKIFFSFFGGCRGRVGGVKVDVNEELKFFVKIRKKYGGGGVGLGGIRVDVNEELKFLGKFKKKNMGGGVGSGGRVGGSGWM